FDGSTLPTQPQQGSGDAWPYSHSEHELASLLHNLDINSHFRMPNVYYSTQGWLYSEAMTYRQQFPPPPFYPRFPSPEAWTEYRRVDQIEYEAIMNRNEAVFYEQYEAHMKAQEEQRVAAASASAAAASAGFPMFTFSEFGMDDPGEFNNFTDPPASG
ncbi:hypothetical protein A2U01_0039713, partial [Trifolium medium]|nr:hypothetical protein [Trifolium medium]